MLLLRIRRREVYVTESGFAVRHVVDVRRSQREDCARHFIGDYKWRKHYKSPHFEQIHKTTGIYYNQKIYNGASNQIPV
jgi:hypothetical protein